MSIRLTAVGALLGLGLSACAPAERALAQGLVCNHPSGVGCFEATVTGPSGTPAQMTGFAKSFGSNADQAWYTQLIGPGGTSSMMILFNGAGRPPTGRHPIADFIASDASPPSGEFIGTGTVSPPVSGISGFSSIRGTLEVTASSAGWVEGTFQFQARETSTGQVVTVDGRFKAQNEVM